MSDSFEDAMDEWVGKNFHLTDQTTEQGEPRGAGEMMDNRREVLGFLTDDLLAWWLSGAENEEMREWWQTKDAVDTATETIHVMFQSLEEHGYRIEQEG